jgi:hypothetical protein
MTRSEIVLTAAEHCHFSFGSVQEHQLLAELRPVVKAFGRGGIRKPHDVARALNKAGKRNSVRQALDAEARLVPLE